MFIGWDEIDSALGSHDLWHVDTGKMTVAEVALIFSRAMIQGEILSLHYRLEIAETGTPHSPGARAASDTAYAEVAASLDCDPDGDGQTTREESLTATG